MKISRSILLIVSILLLALPLAAQMKTKSHKIEQTDFDLDAPFKRPIKIHEAILQLLHQEIKKYSLCGQGKHDRVSDIASWFSASAIDLNDDHHPDFFVKSYQGCLNGADNDWFWIFRNTGHGYRLALFGHTLYVYLLKTKTHGLYDIKTSMATAAYFFSDVYKFNGQVYKARVCTEAESSSGPPKWKRVPCSENE
jgi:hypothetical protein